MKKICAVCGKEFETNTKKRICSDACYEIRKKENNHRKHENAKLKRRLQGIKPKQPPKEKQKRKDAKLYKIAAEASKAGLNYGEYMARMVNQIDK